MSTDSSSRENEASSAAPPTAAGPLAKFKRPAAAAEEHAEKPSVPEEPTAAAAKAPAQQPAQPQDGGQKRGPQKGRGNRTPRGGGGQGGPRGDKHRKEDADVDRMVEVEKQARFDSGPRAPVPVPNRRQTSEELEAEIAAALGDLSLDKIVSDQPKDAADRLPNDSRHRTQVAEMHGDNVFFTLGGKNQGVASIRSFKEPPNIGEMVEVVVTGFNEEDQLYELTIPGGSIVAGDWADIAEGSLVEARITGANTGGLECQVGSTRGFIPASQVGLYRIENFGEFVGQKLVCVVTEANERRGNLVLSRRAVLEREKEESKKSLLAELQPGQMREGIVRKVQDFGAFVDLGGIDGLIHVSQMSWERVKDPREVVQEGQKVRVRVEKIDPETGRIGLSLKNPEEHPWMGIEQKLPVGAVVRGPVTRIADFGAFVKLAPGVEGLIHISELAHHKVYKVENIVKEGQEVDVKVLSVDTESQRIGLSLKATVERPTKEGAKPKEEETAADEPPRELAVPKRRGPLKGGTGKPTGGDQFGLKW